MGRTMTLPRALLILAMLTTVGMAVVLLRTETARASHQVQRLHQRAVALRHRQWSVELELARLRAPERIGSRAAQMGLEVRPPPLDPAAGVQFRAAPGRE